MSTLYCKIVFRRGNYEVNKQQITWKYLRDRWNIHQQFNFGKLFLRWSTIYTAFLLCLCSSQILIQPSTLHRFSAFWLRSKCSICSYQLNIWYVLHWGTSILNSFLQLGEDAGACSDFSTGLGPVLQYFRDRPTLFGGYLNTNFTLTWLVFLFLSSTTVGLISHVCTLSTHTYIQFINLFIENRVRWTAHSSQSSGAATVGAWQLGILATTTFNWI